MWGYITIFITVGICMDRLHSGNNTIKIIVFIACVGVIIIIIILIAVGIFIDFHTPN